MWIGVLVPTLDDVPGVPEARPIGRAALRLAQEGVTVVFGHRAADGVLEGVRARPGAYERMDVAPGAVFDRFPSRSQPTAYRALREGLVGVPWANPPALVELCSDKLATQQVLTEAGLRMPPVESDPARFAARLREWGAAFVKPRYGAYGRGIRRVRFGEPVPSHTEGAVIGESEPAFVQRAVPPPVGIAGLSCRILVQRLPTGSWWVETPVARRHPTDPVVNAARGAEVVPLVDAAPRSVTRVQTMAHAAAAALAAQPGGEWLVEIGVDVVLDHRGTPWLIEVNSRPRGRLEALATSDPAQYADAHVQACARPLRFLAHAAYGRPLTERETP